MKFYFNLIGDGWKKTEHSNVLYDWPLIIVNFNQTRRNPNPVKVMEMDL